VARRGLTVVEDGRIRIDFVQSCEEEPVVQLYRSGGWWKDDMDPSKIGMLISGSYLFTAAIETSTGRCVGMGRAISDGVADAYIQDVVVLSDWRRKGVGRMIVSALLKRCRSQGISWIGLIAQPGTEEFYSSLGFSPMEGHLPMLLTGEID
jgi:ribosomal protein S18 acetylase RimI-like enzyme